MAKAEAPQADDTKPGRWLEYLPVDALIPDPRNPKQHAEGDIDASLDRFGYVEPIVIDERTGMLISGHGRRERILAALAEGKDPPEGVELSTDGDGWVVPVNRGWASKDDDEAMGYLVAANSIGPKGGWVDELLATGLQALASTTMEYAGTGFDSAGVEELLRSTGQLAEQRGSFLDSLADQPGSARDPMQAGQAGGIGDDVVDFRLPMAPAQRDELMLQLRQHQRTLGAETLADTLRQVAATWTPAGD